MAPEADSNPSKPDEPASERRRQLADIVIAALSLTGDARAAHLASACGEDPELRREVESLLAQESRADAFLETPALEAAARALAAGDSPSLGPYQQPSHRCRSAQAGGRVYRSWDTFETRRRPQVSRHGSPATLRPSNASRAGPAPLSHPNICTVTIGRLDGRPSSPWNISGQNLRARRRRPTATAQDLEYAIQFAHGSPRLQKGIVHRDLKPNLWVTPSISNSGLRACQTFRQNPSKPQPYPWPPSRAVSWAPSAMSRTGARSAPRPSHRYLFLRCHPPRDAGRQSRTRNLGDRYAHRDSQYRTAELADRPANRRSAAFRKTRNGAFNRQPTWPSPSRQ